ncbi:hypothetical protein GCM10027020_12690 [Nocardioides salsibiostraticola]
MVDGNERLTFAATIAVPVVNGRRLTLTNDEACNLVLKVAAGQLKENAEPADRTGLGASRSEAWLAHRSRRTPMPATGTLSGDTSDAGSARERSSRLTLPCDRFGTGAATSGASVAVRWCTTRE